MSTNIAVLRGHLTRDPDLRYTPSGTAICDFTIANNKTWMKDGEKKEKVNFISCICWGARGETISKFFQKGKEIEVIGELDFQSWENKEGEKRSTVKINVNQFHFVGGQQQRETGNATGAQEPQFPKEKIDVPEEEIPF